ncbi:MAG: YwaF family protein [Eubacteriaceae bacterium]|nr:YwaF family protein [Eubacteriaceae bacterium]
MEFITTYKLVMPEGHGFSHYDKTHLSFLFILAVAGAIIVVSYKKAAKKRQDSIRICLASIVLAMEVAKHSLVASQGLYSYEILPLHLCGFSIFFMLADAALAHRGIISKPLREMMFCLSLPGAAAALAFPDWTIYPAINVFAWQSFFIHLLEITYPCMLVASGQHAPRVKNLYGPVIFLLVAAPAIYKLNHIWDTNFFFLNQGSPGSPLVFLEDLLGNPGYLFGFAGLVFLVWFLMYAPIEIIRARTASNKPGQQEPRIRKV